MPPLARTSPSRKTQGSKLFCKALGVTLVAAAAGAAGWSEEEGEEKEAGGWNHAYQSKTRTHHWGVVGKIDADKNQEKMFK